MSRDQGLGRTAGGAARQGPRLQKSVIRSKKKSKALPLFVVLPLFIQKKLKCMLLFGVLPLLGRCSYLGGYPPFGHFLAISGIFRSKRCAKQASPGMQASRENGTPPLGGHLRGTPEGQFGTPRGGVPFSLLACIPWEACLAHRFDRKIPEISPPHLPADRRRRRDTALVA